jgi:hypothetical protein
MVTFIFVLIHANNGICKVYIRVFKVNEKNNLLKLIYVFFQLLQGIAFVEIENNSLKKKARGIQFSKHEKEVGWRRIGFRSLFLFNRKCLPFSIVVCVKR